jgi:hypothetical protein
MLLLSHINFPAVIVAAIAAIAIGSIWFGPRTFFPVWWAAMGRPADEKPGGQNMAVVFGSTFVAQFVQAFAVAIVVAMQADRGNNQLGAFDGLFIGLLLGVGIAAAASLTHRLFAGQSFKVWAIEVGNDIVSLTVMSVIIALWR